MLNSDKYYLSSNIFIKKNKLYYEENSSKTHKINSRNMFKYLAEYGWEKLPIEWRRKLNNNNFLLLDCGADGNCLFHVIAEALNNDNLSNNENENKDSIKLYDVTGLRKIASDCINNENFTFIIESYKMEAETGDFLGDWDPSKVNTFNELQDEIIKEGDNFWGDHIILQLLGEKLQINFIIFNSPLGDECSFYNSDLDNLKFDKTILIYYDSLVHFNLIGFFDGNLIKTAFTKPQIPDCITF